MANPRFTVQVENETGKLQPFTLASDQQGKPVWSSHVLPPVHISIYSQSEESRYANLLPGVGSVYAQGDLSSGMGKKVEVRLEEATANRYYYTEWVDASSRGQVQKGPAVTTLSAPANSGAMTGMFVLGGTPYLLLGRIFASWASDSLTQRNDLTGSNISGGAATFFRLGTAASVEAASPAGTTVVRIDTADTLIAQQIRMDDSGVLPLAKVDVKIVRTGTVTGDVRLRVMPDLNGAPSMTDVASARILAADVPTGALTVETFRFDSDTAGQYLMNTQETFWIVMDVAGAGAATYIDWLRDTATSTYSRGAGYVSTDGGNTWNVVAGSGEDMYFNAYAQTPTTTAFVGVDTASIASVYTTDGASYTSNGTIYSGTFCVVSDLLVRGLRSTNSLGAIEYSDDGANWSEPVGVGDVTVGITALLALGEALIVCKQDGFYAVDFSALPTVTIEPLYGAGGAVGTNGQGSCVWRGTAYIPFNGRLMAVEGDFTNGFTVHGSVGIEALPEWDWPWGQGRHVACAPSRFALYSVVSTSGGYRLLKSANPLREDADKQPDPEWHGSLATIGDGTQTIQYMGIFDPGGSGSEQLFCTTTSNNVARIQLPRSANPASDTTYPYDVTTAGDLYLPYATGNYPVHAKAWLTESVTFLKKTPSDYVECLYDTLDDEGWRRLPQGRLYDTGSLPYPRGAASRLNARRVRLINTLATASPLLAAFSVSYAVRNSKATVMREITFSVLAEDGLTAADLGELLGLGADSQRDLLAVAAGDLTGTRRMEDPYGRTFSRVLFLDATDVLTEPGRAGAGRSTIQVSAVAIGP